MDRRLFLQTGLASAAVTAAATRVAEAASDQPKRVGLIGTGWYGKCDLLRLIQVAPVEVVSLCDVDSTMVSEAAEIVASRQLSKKKPRTYSDYREMLGEKDLDIVLVATPDHWHALPMIEAVKSGADVFVQKPISVDVVEGHAMLAAARKYNRVVQVGMQRRSTPHLIDARDKIIKTGKLGTIGMAEVYCYYHMRSTDNPPNTEPPANLDYEMWTGPAPMRPYNQLVHPRRWRVFMEYCNGIMGDMCVHMLDMVRWMCDLGWPKHVSSAGGILVQKEAKANTADTQTATFDFEEFPVVWQHRTYGHAADPEYPWGATIYGDQGTLKLDVRKFEFIPRGSGETIRQEWVDERDKYPEDATEKDLEVHVASAIRGHMRDFLANIESRGKPVSDIEQGYITTTSCILANLSMQLGRSLKWNPQTHQIDGDDEANALLRRPYRAPWVHPDPHLV
jgi:predicted dehydrogenase